MIDIERIETLALFAQAEHAKWEEAGKPWPQPNRALLDMILGLSPLAVLELIAHIESEGRTIKLLHSAGDEVERILDGVIAERDQLKAENEALRKDAERLDWIDENFEGFGDGQHFDLRLHVPNDLEPGGLRWAIDVAMANEQQEKP